MPPANACRVQYVVLWVTVVPHWSWCGIEFGSVASVLPQPATATDEFGCQSALSAAVANLTAGAVVGVLSTSSAASPPSSVAGFYPGCTITCETPLTLTARRIGPVQAAGHDHETRRGIHRTGRDVLAAMPGRQHDLGDSTVPVHSSAVPLGRSSMINASHGNVPADAG